MARAIAKCTCKECGEKFEKIKFCYNRTAANDFEAWAEENITLCPKCWSKHNWEAQKDRVREIEDSCGVVFPKLTAVSDKQLNYALKVRAEYVAENVSEYEVKKLLKFIVQVERNKAEIEKKSIEAGKTFDEVYAQALKKRGFDRLYCVLTESNAGKLLDKLLH